MMTTNCQAHFCGKLATVMGWCPRVTNFPKPKPKMTSRFELRIWFWFWSTGCISLTLFTFDFFLSELKIQFSIFQFCSLHRLCATFAGQKIWHSTFGKSANFTDPWTPNQMMSILGQLLAFSLNGPGPHD